MLRRVVRQQEPDLLQLDQLAHRAVADAEVAQQLQGLGDDGLRPAPVLEVGDDLPDDHGEHHGLVVQPEDLGQPPVHLGGLLNLITHINLTELLKKTEECQFQLFTAALEAKMKKIYK